MFWESIEGKTWRAQLISLLRKLVGERNWEYYALSREVITVQELNELGDEGWELIQYIPSSFTYIFKRVKR